MATRSFIAVQNPDSSIDYNYCHWDGYPQHNGKMLMENYQDMDKVNDLMKLGSLSSLGETVGFAHQFGNTPDNYNGCVAYRRDRGEGMSHTKVRTAKSFDAFMKEVQNRGDIEYAYVFDGEFWNCYAIGEYSHVSINMYADLWIRHALA